MVAASLPVLHYALFRDNSTQTHVTRKKRLRTNFLGRIAFAARGHDRGKKLDWRGQLRLQTPEQLRRGECCERREAKPSCYSRQLIARK